MLSSGSNQTLRVDKSFDWRWGLKKKELLDTLISVMMTGLELIFLDGNFEEAIDTSHHAHRHKACR
ncbi:MAG: hypothetical protein ACLUE2_14750 [Bacteroides cellulosilyticus]